MFILLHNNIFIYVSMYKICLMLFDHCWFVCCGKSFKLTFVQLLRWLIYNHEYYQVKCFLWQGWAQLPLYLLFYTPILTIRSGRASIPTGRIAANRSWRSGGPSPATRRLPTFSRPGITEVPSAWREPDRLDTCGYSHMYILLSCQFTTTTVFIVHIFSFL